MNNSIRKDASFTVRTASYDNKVANATQWIGPTFIISLGLAVLALLFQDTAQTRMLVADSALCFLLLTLTRSQVGWLFLFHPLVILWASLLFADKFIDLGDGVAYKAVVEQYLDPYSGSFNPTSWVLKGDLLTIFKHASFGAAPIFFIPQHFIYTPAPEDYYIWQALFHTGLVTIVVILARIWNAMEMRHLSTMAMYALMGPSFFDLGAAPTRHFVTFFGVFIFLVSYLAARNKLSVSRLLGVGLGALVIIVSKAVLLGPVLAFVLLDRFLIARRGGFRTTLIALLALGALSYFWFFLTDRIDTYLAGTAQEGAASFSSLTRIPVVGVLFKFLYAILAPFPWSKAELFINTTYGGNWLLFLAHVGSSLFGLYFATLIIIRWRILSCHPSEELRVIIAYASIMSISILGGATGFHVYLLIYFPFFATLLAWPRLQVSVIIPLAVIVATEGVLMAMSN